jgi:hypothetical protein
LPYLELRDVEFLNNHIECPVTLAPKPGRLFGAIETTIRGIEKCFVLITVRYGVAPAFANARNAIGQSPSTSIRFPVVLSTVPASLTLSRAWGGG